VARSTTFAITLNREWSSTPVTTFASRSSPLAVSTIITPPTMSICHNCIGACRCQRRNESRRRLRGLASSRPCRDKIRFTVRSDTTNPPGSARRNNSIRIRFAPHRGCARRNSTTRTSTDPGT
jgi:hypothetical protein